jgi:urease accessory protein
VNLKLLQLASPSLPVGAYSYSQGLEAAVEARIVTDAASAQRWIGDVLELSVAAMEGPVLLRLIDAWRASDLESVQRWNEEFIASRETSELRAETLQMGYSMSRLLKDLDAALPADFVELSYPGAFAFAIAHWKVDPQEALSAYLFSWIENQVLAALKSMPLGQTEGQRMLLALADQVPAAVDRALALGDDDLTNFAPGLAILSARHETQYSRIFRS